MGAPALAEETRRVALEILEPPGRAVLRDVPISVGVVFTKGAFRASQNGRVVDDRALKVAEARPQQPRGYRDEPRGGRRSRY